MDGGWNVSDVGISDAYNFVFSRRVTSGKLDYRWVCWSDCECFAFGGNGLCESCVRVGGFEAQNDTEYGDWGFK